MGSSSMLKRKKVSKGIGGRLDNEVKNSFTRSWWHLAKAARTLALLSQLSLECKSVASTDFFCEP